MESVGTKLRQERLRQGLTLNDVTASTRISLKNLQAIENDELSNISSAFFYRSFVRQFAQRVGLNYSELAAAVQGWASTMPEPPMPGRLQAPLPNVPRLQPSRPKSFRWLFSFFALVAVLTGCSTLYGMWESSRYSLQASVTSFVKSLTGTSKNRTSQDAVLGGNKATSAAVARAPQKIAPPVQPPVAVAIPPARFRVEVAAIERTWLSITADEKEIYNGVLEAAETKVLEAHETGRIRAGNAGGVNVLFNGKTIGALGPRGEVRTVVFTKDNYQIVEPPAHIALTGFNPSGE